MFIKLKKEQDRTATKIERKYYKLTCNRTTLNRAQHCNAQNISWQSYMRENVTLHFTTGVVLFSKARITFILICVVSENLSFFLR